MSFVSDIFSKGIDLGENFLGRSGIAGVFTGKKGTGGSVVDTTPEEFIGLRPDIAEGFSALFGGGPEFEGQFAAGMSPEEQALLQQITQLGTGTALGAQSEDLLSQVLGGEFLTPDSNPYLSDLIASLQRRETENFERFTMPQIRSDFTAAGQRIQPQGSSPFDMSTALSTSDLLSRLSDISTNIGAGAYEAERGRQTEAIGQASQLTTQNLNSAIEGLRAAALPRLIEQFGLDKGLEEFRRRVDMILSALQSAGVLATPKTDVLPGTAATEGIGGELAGAAGGAGIAALFSSSRRFKTANREVGPVLERLDDVPVERWEYKPGVYGHVPDVEHIGPYAEDFNAAFELDSGDQINVADAFGVALAAIKELKARVEELENG